MKQYKPKKSMTEEMALHDALTLEISQHRNTPLPYSASIGIPCPNCHQLQWEKHTAGDLKKHIFVSAVCDIYSRKEVLSSQTFALEIALLRAS
jgi:hypothetical protein